MRKLAIVLSIVMFSALPAAAAGGSSGVMNLIYNLQVCNGAYALCAASTCTPTGGTISVNVAGGGTASFPEAACTCPVFFGPSIADLNGGNMQGSCRSPGPNQVWSLYWPKTNIPQAINNWKLTPAATAAPFQLCSSDEAVGGTFANCFSFACTLDRKHPFAVPTATCYCPLGENPNGEAVPPDTAVITPAGQCNSDICSEHPVGAAFPALDGHANECLGSSGGSSMSPGLVP
jgi:hypothetical protein